MSLPVLHTDSEVPAQADGDTHLVTLWLRDKSPATARAYARDIGGFLDAVNGKPLHLITVEDVYNWRDSLAELAPASVQRKLAALKSMFSYGQQLGYLRFNPARVVKSPKPKNRLTERILSESAVHAMIATETDERNRRMLRLMYATGCRVSELTALTWRDITPLDDGTAVVNVYGKGDRTRQIAIESDVWSEVSELRGEAGADAPVFVSQRGGHLDSSAAWRIVRAAARRAGIESDVSPHWLRHCTATHALHRGAPLPLVQQTLGHASLVTTSKYVHVRPGDCIGRYLTA